jgi:hypothetical protein
VPLHQPWHRPRRSVIVINLDVDASWLLLIDRAGLSSSTSFVVIIADNHLHHQYRNIVATATTLGQRQTPTRSSPSPTSDAAQLQAENPGLISDMFYNSIAIDNYHFFFVHHDLAARVAVYFYLHVRAQVFSLQLLRLLRHGGQLLRTDCLRRSSLLSPPALARMAHDGPCLCTSGAGNTDACLRPRHAPESSKLGTAYRATSTTTSSTLSTTTTTANTTAKFLWLNDDIDLDNINLIDFIYDDYITNGIIDHDYSTLIPGYIDIGNKSYHLTSGLCSRPSVSLPIRLRGVLEYITCWLD